MGKVFPTIEMNDKMISFDDQLIYEQLFPVVCSSILFFEEEFAGEEAKDKFRENAMEKHYSRLLPVVYYHFYGLKNYLRGNFSFCYCIETLEYILLTKKYYDRNKANIVLSLCIYNFEDICQIVSREDDSSIPQPLIMEYLAHLMEVIITLITEFDLNWQDILETLTLMEITLTVLSSWKSTTCVIVKGLNLVRLVVFKKLSVSMALLTDQIDGDMAKLLTVCAEKLDDEKWEIQNAAIQVVESIVSSPVSTDFVEFPSMVISKQLPTKITQIAFQHEKWELKASALKCLQEMVKIDEFWTDISTKSDMCDNSYQILSDARQKAIHKEAAKLISMIYKYNHNLSITKLCDFYDVMTYIFIEDFDTETKINALQFWKIVIHRHLTDQGWIDGKFPEATFSTDSKKIVIMTDIEIRKRLVKVLFQLSENGCLFALKCALEDKNNEFFKTVKLFWTKMSEVLNQYEVGSSKLKYFDHLHNKSDYSKFQNDAHNVLTKIRRQTLHPEVFLQTIDFFSNNINTNQVSHQKSDIISLFEEILNEEFSST